MILFALLELIKKSFYLSWICCTGRCPLFSSVCPGLGPGPDPYPCLALFPGPSRHPDHGPALALCRDRALCRVSRGDHPLCRLRSPLRAEENKWNVSTRALIVWAPSDRSTSVVLRKISANTSSLRSVSSEALYCNRHSVEKHDRAESNFSSSLLWCLKNRL